MDLQGFYGPPEERPGPPEERPGPRLLHIDCSPQLHNSYTRQLSGGLVQAWQAAYPTGSVEHLDLAYEPPPHVTAAVAHLLHTGALPDGELSSTERAAIEQATTLVDQFVAADVYVLGVPMYYAHVPSTLKAYMDHLPYFGRTVTLTPDGPQGLLTGKQAVVITARGFDYAPGSPLASFDLQEPWLRNALAFIGITDVTFINLNDLDGGEAASRRALVAAQAALAEVRARWTSVPAAVHSGAQATAPDHLKALDYAETSAVDIEQNKRIVRKFCEDFSHRDVEAVLAALADTATWRVMGSSPLAGVRNRQEFGESLAGITSIIPMGVQMIPKEMTAEGNRVAVETEAYGALSNGKTYRSPLHLLIEIRGGKIQAVREYMDTYHANEIFGA